MKKYNEFTLEEQMAIKNLNNAYFVAEMSDSYSVTLREQRDALEHFNNTFGYNFNFFSADFYGEIEKTWFR